MSDLLFSGHAAWLTVPALVGTAFFLLRLVLMSLGHSGDLHFDVDHHADFGHSDAHHGDPADAFRLLSVQSIAAFLMGFGWGGLGALRGADWTWPTSIGVGVGCGIGMVWLLGLLLKALIDMQSSGNISADSTVGLHGDVYASIPPFGAGRGQVQVVVNERQRIYNAVSNDGPLPTNTRIRITAVNKDNTLTVTAI